MPKEQKEDKPVDKPKQQTPDEFKASIKTDLSFFRDITNFVKQMKDNGCLNPMFENEIKNFIETNLRSIFGMPEKIVPPTYSPPTPAPTMPQPPYPQYQPR